MKEAPTGACARRIAEDLHALGVREGGVLLVHSSMKSLGPVPGGIPAVLEGLALALGPAGTLLMPALSYQSVGRDSPVFRVLDTPSCVGAIPEHFRTVPGTLRSMHPTHSVCGRGRLAAEILGGHAADRTPCGANSPFTRLRQYGGSILMLGCGLNPNTSMHAVEEAAGAPYLMEREPVGYTLVDADGSALRVLHTVHGHFPQHYDRIRPRMAGRGLWEGRVLEAACHLIDAEAFWQCASQVLDEDIYFFFKD